MMSAFLPDIPKAPCMKKHTNIKTLNPEPYKTPEDFGHGTNVQQSDQTPVVVSPQSYRDDLVDFDVDSCSETEYKELEDKFVSHVARIRSFVKHIEARELDLDKTEDFELRKEGISSSIKKGEKRAMQVSSDRESKRSKIMEVNLIEARKVEAAMMRKCGAILDKLMKHKHGWVFNKPVDVVALKIPDYYEIVKRPMDLGTVKMKLGKGVYGTPLDFAKDVRLTFDNAMLYNLKGDAVHKMAVVLLDIFDKSFDPAYEKFEVERQSVIVEQRKLSKPLDELTRDDTEEALCDAAPLVKALDTKNCEEAANKSVSKKQRTVKEVKENSRMRGNMSDLEREQLGLVLQELAEEYLDEILQIVAKRNAKMTMPNEDGEVELDFEALDDETMWDLHRFVRLNSKARESDKVI